MTKPPPKKVLVATVGLAPQVVTETLYALIAQSDPPFVPDEIHIVTTIEGRLKAAAELIGNGVLARFAAEFNAPKVAHALTVERIHVISTSAGEPLSDITTEEANAASSDQINHLMRTLTSDESTTLHVSIAGGRKTMGFFLGSVLSLYARPQDRLSHVLVAPAAFELHPDFYYPPRVPLTLSNPRSGGEPLNTTDAKISLAEIPFVRLRNGLPRNLLDGHWTYSETVEKAQALVGEPNLVIDRESGQISCGGRMFSMSAVLIAFYWWMAERRSRLGAVSSVHYREADKKEILRAHIDTPGVPQHVIEKLKRDISAGDDLSSLFQGRKNRINSALSAALGQGDTIYHIHNLDYLPDKSGQRQGLIIDPSAIHFAALEQAPGNEI